MTEALLWTACCFIAWMWVLGFVVMVTVVEEDSDLRDIASDRRVYFFLAFWPVSLPIFSIWYRFFGGRAHIQGNMRD